jgi:hypothetical protein
VANLHRPDWDAEQDRAPFRWKRARLGRQAGGEQLTPPEDAIEFIGRRGESIDYFAGETEEEGK